MKPNDEAYRRAAENDESHQEYFPSAEMNGWATLYPFSFVLWDWMTPMFFHAFS